MSDTYPAGSDAPVVTSNDPDEIRAQIELTRANLSSDVNQLGDRVKPGNVARRQADKARGAASGLKDKVMGAAPSFGSSGSSGSAGSSVSDSVSGAASTVSDKASSLPGAVRGQTQGNPLVAGVVAFGLGYLVSALLPTAQVEQDAARTVKAKAEPLKEAVTDAAKESAQNLKGTAQEAVESVKQTAQDGVANVQGEGRSAAEDVKSQADDAKATVQDSRA